MSSVVAIPLAASGRRSAIRTPFHVARTPSPASSLTSVRLAASTPRAANASTSARLSGWRLFEAKASATLAASAGRASSTAESGRGRPTVRVPVLSITTRVTAAMRSSAEPSLTITPIFISAPQATT